MSEKLQAPKGTFDVLPEDWATREPILSGVAQQFGDAGYRRIETPVFEDTALFARGVGESTDVVSKEMYTFEDQGGRSITLRPEGTAPVARAYVEHGMHKLPQPVKLWYTGPFFRQEAPQAGRFREFFQIGCEALGSDSPLIDAESIVLLEGLLCGAGVRESRLRISSLGSRAERAEYSEELRSFLRANQNELSVEVRDRIDLNPLRAFDSKHEGTIAVMATAPRLLDRISSEDRAHFEEVLKFLDLAQVKYEIDPTLVRGLDYYTRTVFEFTSDKLGAQSGLGGGGRYDSLVEMLGGPSTPGVGWAAGIERIVAASTDENDAKQSPKAFIALDEGVDFVVPFGLAIELRRRRHGALMETMGRSMKNQLKQADRAGVEYLVIFGGERGAYDAAVKNMKTGEQVELQMSAADYVERIAEAIGA